jgi:hypothetical protein
MELASLQQSQGNDRLPEQMSLHVMPRIMPLATCQEC